MLQPDTDDQLAAWLLASGWQNNAWGWHLPRLEHHNLSQEAAAELQRHYDYCGDVAL